MSGWSPATGSLSGLFCGQLGRLDRRHGSSIELRRRTRSDRSRRHEQPIAATKVSRNRSTTPIAMPVHIPSSEPPDCAQVGVRTVRTPPRPIKLVPLALDNIPSVNVHPMPRPSELAAPGTAHMEFEDVCGRRRAAHRRPVRVTRGDIDLLIVHTRPARASPTTAARTCRAVVAGTLEEYELACPLHRGRFDVRSGGGDPVSDHWRSRCRRPLSPPRGRRRTPRHVSTDRYLRHARGLRPAAACAITRYGSGRSYRGRVPALVPAYPWPRPGFPSRRRELSRKPARSAHPWTCAPRARFAIDDPRPLDPVARAD